METETGRPCPVCEAPATGLRKYCSDLCSVQAQIARDAAKRTRRSTKVLMQKVCDVCKVEYGATSFASKYCSDSCRVKGLLEVMARTKVEK